MKRYRIFFCIFLLLIGLIIPAAAGIINLDEFINGSTPVNVANTKIIDYINRKRTFDSSAVYCIGQDKVKYFETFLDEERDYYGLPFSQHLQANPAIKEVFRQLKAGTISFRYTHNPTFYDNAVPVSERTGHWYDCRIEWDEQKNKWRILDDTGMLFTEPTDFMRGEWKIELKGKDATGKELFDKESNAYAAFRVHKAPIAKFTFTESGNTATLKDNGSYDVDYQYRKNNKRNVAGDRQYSGIKEFYWMAKIGDEWIDVGKGPSVTFAKNGLSVSDYRLTVEDYDGAFTTITASAMPLEKPTADFYFSAGSQATQYFYEGNKGHETAQVSPSIGWNDEAYAKPPYTSSGTRTEKWTAVKTGDSRNTVSAFNADIMKNKFAQILQGKKLEVELEVKNKFDETDAKQKFANLITLSAVDQSNTVDTVSCAFCNPVITPLKPYLVGSQFKPILDITNKAAHQEDLTVQFNAPAIGVSDLKLAADDDSLRFQPSAAIKLQDPASYQKAW